ncbi:hypothetical protein F3Y22_tig00014444pilonHSYRG00200 [Hibiscus syriacus]|uniref:RNase H type-1 domain-containing protein n=1 Tax=Hibiscus syriacus TaxID=106335 RepID=A0A6A3C4V2_HIBSY|nr:hypothetical protein F3Y22_tig00014444pilonHSYRG00200 [Hibiscus syriacus]
MRNSEELADLVAWKAAENGKIKLNTDGANQGNPGIPSAGEVFRNESGMWLLGFSAYLGTCLSLAAELHNIRIGLSFA